MKKRLLSTFLCLCMALTLLPAPVRAAEGHSHDAVSFTPWNTANALPTTAGNYYLTTDVTLSNYWLVGNDIHLCLNGHTVTQSKADTQVIWVYNGATLHIYNCQSGGSLTGGTNSGVYVGAGNSIGTFYLHGGAITGNSGFTQNNATHGGGVYVVDGSFTMDGGSIQNNTATYGGGVYIRNGNFNLNGGQISGNQAQGSGSAGGGVYLQEGTASMTDGSIVGNSATSGGGICTAGGFSMTGGSVQGNSATYGGGVFMNTTGSFTLSGGRVAENTATNSGNAVYHNGQSLSLSGGVLKGTTHLRSGKAIAVTTGLSTETDITLTTADTPTAAAPVKVAQGSGHTLTAADLTKFTSATDPLYLKDNAIYSHAHSWSTDWTTTDTHHWHNCGSADCPIIEDSGKDGYGVHVYDDDQDASCACGYTRTLTPPHAHAVSVGCETDSGDQVTFDKALTSVDGALYIDGEAAQSGNTLPPGNYYLAEDVILSNRMTVTGVSGDQTVNLCLNGHKLALEYTGIYSRNVIYVQTTTYTLNICDCDPSGGPHTITSPVTGEEVTVHGGLITGGKGAGVNHSGSSSATKSLILYGGTIAGNTSTSDGGGVSATNLVIHGGSIVHNQGENGGGVAATKSAVITGGTIAHNKCTADGGGIYLGNSTLTLTVSGNVVVEDNVKDTAPSNLYLGYYHKIAVAPGGLGENARVGVTTWAKPTGSNFVAVAEAGTGYTITGDDFAAFSYDQPGYYLTLNSAENAIQLGAIGITTQPTADSPAVGVNYAPEGIAYQWYPVSTVTENVTDQNTTNDRFAGSYADGKWTAVKDTSNRRGYFSIALMKGDVVTVTVESGSIPSGSNTELCLRERVSRKYDTKNLTADQTVYTLTAPVEGTYDLEFYGSADTALVISAVAKRAKLGGAVSSQTTSKLTATAAGSYLCQVSWPDGFILDSDPVDYLVAHSHPVCGETCAHDDAHANMAFAKALTGDADGKLYIDGVALSTETEYGNTFYTIPSGSYYLAGDIEISTPIRIGTSQNTEGQAVDLCFNGHTIHYTENEYTGNFMTVYAPFTTCDCQEGQTGGVSGDPTNLQYDTYSLLYIYAPTTLYGGVFTREQNGHGINMRYVNAGVTVDGATIRTRDVAINGQGPSVGVTIKSGRVESTNGTAVVLKESPRFTMEGGTLIGQVQGAYIKCEEVREGVTSCGTISGGTIQSEQYGLFLCVDKPLTLTGAPVIKGGESFGDIVFSPNSANMLNIGELGDQVYTVDCWAGTGFITEDNPYAISVAANTDQTGHFKTLSNDTTHSIRDVVDGDGNHIVEIYKAHSHPICGKTCTHQGAHTAVAWTNWDKADSLPTDAGNYVLTGDVTLSNAWTVPQGVTNLCMGGHTIQRATGGPQNPITIPSGSALHICDCSENKTGTINGYGGNWTISVLGTLSLYGGTVTYGSIGVNVSHGGVFQMHGGSVKGITGTGVQVREDCTFLMDGGSITGNRYGVLSEGVFRAEGDVVIDGNSRDGDASNVVMQTTYEGQTVVPVPMELSGPLGANAKIGLSLYAWENMEEVSPFLAVHGYNGYAVTAADFAKLSSDKVEDYPLKFNGGKVYFTVPQTHSHTWATAWSSDANGHWHACTAEGCDITDYANCGETGAAYSAHVYTNDQDITCNTCGYTRSVALYGTVSITGTAKIGGTLTASVSGAPSGVTLTYQWTVEGGDGTILGTTAAYTPGAAAVVGKNLVCTVSTADTHYTGTLTATTAAVTLGDRTAPTGLFTVTDVPVGGTTGSIAVSADADKLEYRKVTDPATETWTAVAQSGNTATLSQLEGGSYEFRYKETATHNASPATTVQVRVLTSQAKALTIAEGMEHGTVTKRRDMVNPGDTVTLAVQPDEGYELETITVRYTEGGVEKTITPTVKADNPAQYTFTMPDADVTVTATFAPVPPEGDVTGEVEVKGDAPAVAVDEETLKDLAGEIQDGDTVTVKLTVEKQDSPTDKDELEAIISGKKDDVLYLDLSLLKQVNDAAPQPITDTEDKVLEIVVDYDFTGKKDVTVYRKHGENDAEKLTKLTVRPADGFTDGSFFADSAGGKVYVYASKFSTYAIGYTAQTTTPSRPSGGSSSGYQWPFVDVRRTDTWYQAVKYVYDNKLMEGTSATTFDPEGQLTRAMLATVLYRAAGSPKVEGAPEFEDTLADTWYSDAIIWASRTQVLRGYGNGKFGPDDPVSKEMMNMVTARQAGQDPAWVGDPALALPATRAEIAAMLMGLCKDKK